MWIKIEKFLIYGWRLTTPFFQIVQGLDAHGSYCKFTCPYYKTLFKIVG